MTQEEKDALGRRVRRKIYIGAYILAVGVYGAAGGLALKLLFPALPLILMMVVSGFVAMKLDYRFKGPASKFEQRYVLLKDKK